MYIVISCPDHSISIIESQEIECIKLFEGTYLQCEQFKVDLIEEYGYLTEPWGNTIKQTQ